MEKKNSGLGKFVLGAAVGAGLGLLFAPKKGSELRKDIRIKFEEMVEYVKEIDVKEVQEEFTAKLNNLKKELAELDKEKVLDIAKEKARQLGVKAEELVELAKEKGTPVLKKAANDLRLKTVDVGKEIVNKLEKSEIK